jgi:hypothetical protein
MSQQPLIVLLVLLQVIDHVLQHRRYLVFEVIEYRKESFRGLANVQQPVVIEQDLLHDEGSHSARQFQPLLHDPQTQRDDLRLHQEIDGVRIVALHQRTNHAETRHPQVLESLLLVRSVQKGVQEQG